MWEKVCGKNNKTIHHQINIIQCEAWTGIQKKSRDTIISCLYSAQTETEKGKDVNVFNFFSSQVQPKENLRLLMALSKSKNEPDTKSVGSSEWDWGQHTVYLYNLVYLGDS